MEGERFAAGDRDGRVTLQINGTHRELNRIGTGGLAGHAREIVPLSVDKEGVAATLGPLELKPERVVREGLKVIGTVIVLGDAVIEDERITRLGRPAPPVERITPTVAVGANPVVGRGRREPGF